MKQNPNKKAKEITKKYIEEGFSMEESLSRVLEYCCDMVVKDRCNVFFWACTGLVAYTEFKDFKNKTI
jgi:hypothetical protein